MGEGKGEGQLGAAEFLFVAGKGSTTRCDAASLLRFPSQGATTTCCSRTHNIVPANLLLGKTHTPPRRKLLGKIGFPDCSGTVTVTDSMLESKDGELLLGSEVTRQVVASPPSLTNLIS